LAAPSVNASMDRDTITMGESATLTLSFEGGKPDAVPAIPGPGNLTIQHAGQSTSFSIVNGQTSFVLGLAYHVTPSQPGEYTIPAITVTVDGQKIRSQPLKLRVLKSDSATGESSSMARFAFLKLVVTKTNLYVGEVLPVEVQLYYATTGEQLQTPQLQSEGFSFGQMLQTTQTQNPPTAQVGNLTYRVLTFKTTATAARTG